MTDAFQGGIGPAVAAALAGGWTEAAIVAVLSGAVRGEDGHVLPWCHRCDLPIHDDAALRMPTDDANVCEVWCPRCLTGPT